jgi:hypothetical protein
VIIDRPPKNSFHSFYVHWGGRRRIGVEYQTGEWGYDFRLFTRHRSWLVSRRPR